jgi:peptidoglycan hydrolase CwlO-like protein
METVMVFTARKFDLEESMEARIARLEATTEHIQSDVQTLRQEMKELNSKLDSKFEQIQKAFESMRIGRVLDRVWILLSMGAMLGVMARGFKWI